MISLGEWIAPIPRAALSRNKHLKASDHDYHEPVLLTETVEALAPAPGKIIVDGTLGGGGHAAALLERGARVVGIDQDEEAIGHASQQLRRFGERFTAVKANFARADQALDALACIAVDGVLLDLGVSSHQLRAGARGFSFLHDGPLDMRMDLQATESAADLLNHRTEEQLAEIFRRFGEEPHARKIAGRIVRARGVQPLSRTQELAELVASVVPRHGKTHPATRVFQALRIAVNRELDVLEIGLLKFSSRLRPGGRLAVITFHSLEDRIVKRFFAERSTEWVDRPEWPEPRPNPELIFKRITRKAVVAGKEEQQRNPRSRSARLRVVEKLTPCR